MTFSWGSIRFPYEAHMIFYTIASEQIFIVRVLHARADFKRHFNNMSD
jgi:plasmid stabilization system protein ParE